MPINQASIPPLCSMVRMPFGVKRIAIGLPRMSDGNEHICRLGCQRRRDLLFAWLTLLPKCGFLPLTVHTRDIIFTRGDVPGLCCFKMLHGKSPLTSNADELYNYQVAFYKGRRALRSRRNRHALTVLCPRKRSLILKYGVKWPINLYKCHPILLKPAPGLD